MKQQYSKGETHTDKFQENHSDNLEFSKLVRLEFPVRWILSSELSFFSL